MKSFIDDDFISKVLLLIIGFILTTLTGSLLTFLFQRRSWKRQTKTDLYRKKYEDGTKFLDEISELIGKRFFYLLKLVWAIEENDAEKISTIEKEYYKVVNQWNIQFFRNRIKIRLFVNENMVNEFINYSDASDPKLINPQSLHYKFVKTHKIVKASKVDPSNLGDIHKDIEQLNLACMDFVEKLTLEFSKKAKTLELLNGY